MDIGDRVISASRLIDELRSKHPLTELDLARRLLDIQGPDASIGLWLRLTSMLLKIYGEADVRSMLEIAILRKKEVQE